MYKKILTTLVTCILMISLAACGGSDEKESSNATDSTVQENVVANNETQSEEEKPAVNGKVNKYKIYELKRADNDRITIELWYRSGSDYVSQISGGIYAPTGSTEYDSMLADNISFAEKVSAANMPDDIMHFGYDEVKLENGYVRCDFAFKELDADNSDSVPMIAEFLGLPGSNDYFKLSECEEYLQQNGISLVDEH